MSEDLRMEDDFLNEMLGDFLAETDEIVTSLNENLLKLDDWVRSLGDGEVARCDDDLMNEMFRAAHSLKGLSGMLGLDNINKLTHKVENIFDAARNDQLAFTTDVVELIFQSVDSLSCMIDHLRDSDSEPVDCQDVLDGIERVLKGANADHVQMSAADSQAAFAKLQEKTSTPDTVLTSALDSVAAPPSRLREKQIDHFADIVDETEVSAKYLAIFIDESEVALDEIADALVGDVSQASTESLMIQCHKIKGSAASLGLHRPTKLAHFMEDLLQELLQTKRELTGTMVEAMLRCTDSLRAYVEGLKTGDPLSESFNEVYGLLLSSQLAAADGSDGRVAQVKRAPAAATANTAQSTAAAKTTTPAEITATTETTTRAERPAGLSATRRKEIEALAPSDAAGWIVQVWLEQDLPLPGLKAGLVHTRLADVGSLFYSDPAEADLENLAELRLLTFGVATITDEITIREKVQLAGIEQVDFAPLRVTKSSSQDNAGASQAATLGTSSPSTRQSKRAQKGKQGANEISKKPAETLRVDIERLDHLMNLAGQLVINKARFSRIG